MPRTPPQTRPVVLQALVVVFVALATFTSLRYAWPRAHAVTPVRVPWPVSEDRQRALVEFLQRWELSNGMRRSPGWKTVVREVPVPRTQHAGRMVVDFDTNLIHQPRDAILVGSWRALATVVEKRRQEGNLPKWWCWAGHGAAGMFEPAGVQTDKKLPPPPMTINLFDDMIDKLNSFSGNPTMDFGTFADAAEYEAIATLLSGMDGDLEGGVLELASCKTGRNPELAERLAFCLPGTTVIVYTSDVYWGVGYAFGSAKAYQKVPE